MNELRIALALFLLVIIALGVGYYLTEAELKRQRRVGLQDPQVSQPDRMPSPSGSSSGEMQVRVFFCAPGATAPGEGFLVSEERTVLQTGEPVFNARQIVDELVQGPEEEGTAIFRQDATIRQIFVLEDKTAVVDISRKTAESLAGGIRMELCAVHSITRSLVENLEEIDQVRFLVGGKQELTLSGHVSIGKPFL
jgi:hypothetical protein